MVDTKQIQKLLDKHFNIEGKHTINPTTGVVDVKGSVILYKDVKTKQIPITFGKVTKNFEVNNNRLLSLVGSPRWVGGMFYCNYNQLTSLEGAPDHVGGDFVCEYNQLTNLAHVPGHVGGGFFCQYNLLTSLVGSPQKVTGGFSCNHNQLQYLKGGPAQVEGDYECEDNPLVSLEGAPVQLKNGTFVVTYGRDLPLLRVLQYESREINKAPKKLMPILDEQVGHGKAVALRAAGELIRAGYKENARW
jgi:hypothetical protein